MKNFGKILLAVFAILGSVFGAGFMSGTEIYSFFARHGTIAYVTIALNCVVYATFVLFYGLKSAKIAVFVGEKQQNNVVLHFCQLLITAAMMSGTIALLVRFGLPKIWAGPMVFLFVFVCQLIGIKSANFFNVIVSALALVSFVFVFYDGTWAPLKANDNVFAPTILMIFYVAMNIVCSETIVAKVCANKTKKQILLISLVILCLLISVMYALVGLVYAGDMPLIDVIKNKTFAKIYSVIVLLAMLSTMLSSGEGAKQMLKLNNFFASFFVSILSWLVSFVGFENIITYIYPVIGIAMLVSIIFGTIFKIKNKKNYIL